MLAKAPVHLIGNKNNVIIGNSQELVFEIESLDRLLKEACELLIDPLTTPKQNMKLSKKIADYLQRSEI